MSTKPTSFLLLLALGAVLAACAPGPAPEPTVPGPTGPGPTVPQPTPSAEAEPNDSAAAANPLIIGTPVGGRIAGQPRDRDAFRFTAAAGDRLKLSVRSVSADPNSALDPYVSLLLPDGFTVLEHDDDSGAGLESEIRFNLVTGGTYTVTVTSFRIHDDERASDDQATNTYQIALTRR